MAHCRDPFEYSVTQNLVADPLSETLVLLTVQFNSLEKNVRMLTIMIVERFSWKFFF